MPNSHAEQALKALGEFSDFRLQDPGAAVPEQEKPAAQNADADLYSFMSNDKTSIAEQVSLIALHLRGIRRRVVGGDGADPVGIPFTKFAGIGPGAR